TVTFSGSTPFADVRIAEYSGISATNPVDVTISANGTGATANSGNVTTTNARDLLFAAGLTTDLYTGPGAGYPQRVITSRDGDIVEDRFVTATGAYNATAAQNNGAASWIMQLVAFRGA